MEMKKNVIQVKRIPGEGLKATATISVEFDAGDPAAVERVGNLMRELIPEDERADFQEKWEAAARWARDRKPEKENGKITSEHVDSRPNPAG